MRGREGETIEEFEARITDLVEGLIAAGQVSLAETGIVVPVVSPLCPASTVALNAETVAFERNIALQQTLGPLLNGQIDQACEANRVSVEGLIDSETIVRDNAIIQTNVELTRGITILGETTQSGLGSTTEGLSEFGERMRDEFAAGPAIPQASGLPAFSPDCDASDSARLGEATDIINQGLSFIAFNEFLDEKFTTECSNQEFNYLSQIDAAYLDQLEADQEAMVQHWQEICDDCPAGETYDEFVRRLGMDFVASGVTFDSGIEVPEFPVDCLEYVDSLEASEQALALYVQQLEFNLAFDQWARPQYEATQQRICEGVSGSLGF